MEQEEFNKNPNQDFKRSEPDLTYLIPGSIVLAGLIIAGSIYYSNSNQSNSLKLLDNKKSSEKENAVGVEFIKPISPKDHIWGNPNAPVKLIEFIDLECPFCRIFHQTLKKAMAEYGVDGKLALVFRHFPLDAIHPNARKGAVALECANELGGNDKFWEYLDKLYEALPPNSRLDLTILPKLAKEIGLDEAKFRICLESGRYDSRIQEDLDDAQKSGGEGTPFNVIISSNGKKFPFSGAVPYNKLKSIIEKVLTSEDLPYEELRGIIENILNER